MRKKWNTICIFVGSIERSLSEQWPSRWWCGAGGALEAHRAREVRIVGFVIFKQVLITCDSSDDKVVQSKRPFAKPGLEPWRKIISRGAATYETVGFIHLFFNRLKWLNYKPKEAA